MKSALGILVVVLMLAGCATTQGLDVSFRTRLYEADYTTTMKAIMSYLNEKGWQVASADKELGFINTEFKSNDGISAALFGRTRSKINFSLQKTSDNQTKIIASILAEEQGTFGGTSQMNMTEGQARELYQTVFNNIQKQLDALK